MMRPRSEKTEALAFLGMAQRAGALVKGTDAVRQALRRGEVHLLILAEDGAETQRRKLLPLADGKGVRRRTFGTMVELGSALGSGPLAAVGVLKAEFARELKKRLGGD